MNVSRVQSQIVAHGLADFHVLSVSPARSNVREFFRTRIERFGAGHEVRPVAEMASAALMRLSSGLPSEIVYRWEAESELGRIVGYSTEGLFIGVFPWIITTNDAWIASVIRF